MASAPIATMNAPPIAAGDLLPSCRVMPIKIGDPVREPLLWSLLDEARLPQECLRKRSARKLVPP